jgi:ATP-dependent DNA helicase RecQ
MHREKARALLQRMLGPKAEFREGQWEAIDLAAHQKSRALIVQRTGWGKSIVYFIAAKILRDSGAGLTLLISPLLSLMRNQLLAAERLGIRAVTIHSQNVDDWHEVEQRIKANEVDLLIVSPERLANEDFLKNFLPGIQSNIGMFVVDEAHCISDWGHDFRPDYRRIVRILKLLPPAIPVLCTTATANNRVVQDIESQIPDIRILRGQLVRPSLKLFNIVLPGQAHRLAWLAQFLPKLPGSGIVYTLTVQDSRRVAAWLSQRGLAARPYHADLPAQERIDAEEELLGNRVKALVATVALGMGFDKPDLGFVVHFQRPGSVVAYYQQVGRAGRAVDSAFGVLLSGREDDTIQDYFIRTAFPSTQVMAEVARELQAAEAMTIDQLSAALNYPWGTLERALKLLEVEGAVTAERKSQNPTSKIQKNPVNGEEAVERASTRGVRYARTASRWAPDVERADRVTQLRRAEVDEMRQYVEHSGCLMEFLARSLDDPAAGPCGKCMNCTGKAERQAVPAGLIQEAITFLRNDHLVIDARHQWPKSVVERVAEKWPTAVDRFDDSGRAKVTIPGRLRAEEGRVLCMYGDAGWGEAVARGKYESGRFDDALIEAAAELIRGKWKPDPMPEWVTCVPSKRHPELVRDFGQRLAAALGLPFGIALRKTRESQPQKEMQNSPSQVRNLIGGFEVMEISLGEPPSLGGAGGSERGVGRGAGLMQTLKHKIKTGLGSKAQLPELPVLVVDDVVDSGWTLTVAAVLLREHGSGPVYPFALARASLRGS